MYFFLVLALPLGFALLEQGLYPRDEVATTKRALFRGLLASLPLLLAARILGSLVPEAPGRIWSAFHEWADRILPYAFLPGLLYAVFYRYGERLPAGAAHRRLTAFYAGALAPVGLVELFRVWGSPDPYKALVLPLLLAAMVLAMPRLAFAFWGSSGSSLALLAAASLAASLALSCIPFLFLRRFWPLAWLAAGATIFLGWRSAGPELLRRPPPPSE
ncbi:MAG TPA: hypothetical protein PLB91_16350 [Spirochaetales bacterium]|nr:hypothetical protein [Spirochaetales bacterium]HRY54368.1 hypothetical protein [Spirochaetia bacterium]HRZ64054.1 hypothetical protein [Spirochaetia bacterium]